MIYKPPEYPLNIDRKYTDLLFLGGTISGSVDWQAVIGPQLEDRGFTVLNPRRDDFNTLNKAMEKEQIEWEHYYLEWCSNLFFYFSSETVAPITLFEYGCYIESEQKKIVVYAHPKYPRLRDLLIQTELRNPNIFVNVKDLSKGLYD